MKTKKVLERMRELSYEAKKKIFTLNERIANCYIGYSAAKRDGAIISKEDRRDAIQCLHAEKNFFGGFVRGLETAEDLLHGKDVKF
jgi:hypothetical protein